MVTLNVQWLAYPFYAYAIYCLIMILYSAIVIPKTDIGPALIVGLSIYYFGKACTAAVVGWLIWRAFRQ